MKVVLLLNGSSINDVTVFVGNVIKAFVTIELTSVLKTVTIGKESQKWSKIA